MTFYYFNSLGRYCLRPKSMAALSSLALICWFETEIWKNPPSWVWLADMAVVFIAQGIWHGLAVVKGDGWWPHLANWSPVCGVGSGVSVDSIVVAVALFLLPCKAYIVFLCFQSFIIRLVQKQWPRINSLGLVCGYGMQRLWKLQNH